MNALKSSVFLLAAVDPTPTSTKIPLSLVDDPIGYLKIHSTQYATFVVVIVIGFFVSRWVGALTARTLEKQSLEPPVKLLMVRLSRLLVFMLALVVALSAAGFEVAALITGVGVVGVGIGLGMQGLISNVVAGLTIIFTKPFRVGEYIQILTVEGMVRHIDLISTTLEHSDASKVFIPNHKIIGEILHNYGTTRQIELSVGVGYATDLAKAHALVAGILAANPRVLKQPAPAITINNLGDSAITISIKPWVKLDDIVPAQMELNTAIVGHFRANAIDIPFPHREVRVVNG